MASLTSIRVMCSAATERPGSKRVAPTSSSWKEPHSARGTMQGNASKTTGQEMITWNTVGDAGSFSKPFEMPGLEEWFHQDWAYDIETRNPNVKAKDWNSCHIHAPDCYFCSDEENTKRIKACCCLCWKYVHLHLVTRDCPKCGSCWLATLGWNFNPAWELATQTSKLKNDCREQATWHLIFIFGGAIIQIHTKLIKAIVVST